MVSGSRIREAGKLATLAAACWALAAPAGATAETLEAGAVLPPGNSGFVAPGEVLDGTGSPHLTDQNQLLIDFELRPVGFNQPGESSNPKPGVTITRDQYGVASVDAGTDLDAWWGVGWAAGEDRLFQIELFKRAGEGTLAEILGESYLDDDLISRRDYYTDAEMDVQIAKMPQNLRDRLDAYRDGINAHIDTLTTSPGDRPGEFVALNVPIVHFTSRELARVGILLARTVPSGAGNELENAQALLEIGKKDFDFLHPVRAKRIVSTVKGGEGKFKSQPGRSRKDEKRAFKRSYKWLKTIDIDGAGGTGTITQRGPAEAKNAEADEQPGDDLRRILPEGGSFMWAIRDDARKRGYMFNGPQLGFTIPELFYEFELHSPVQNVRGVSAAGIVQARGDGVAFARRYAIWNRELETIVGLTELNDAKSAPRAPGPLRSFPSSIAASGARTSRWAAASPPLLRARPLPRRGPARHGLPHFVSNCLQLC